MKQFTTTTSKTLTSKTLILALILTIATAISSLGAMANTNIGGDKRGELAPVMKTSFHRDFRKATLISSEATERFIKVTFSMDKSVLTAYYSREGKLMGVVHNMLSTELPADLQLGLQQDYRKSWITELFEISNEDGVSYYVSIQNADEIINLRATEDHGWEIYSRTAKN